MAKLGGLINGQDIAFDTHQAGDGQCTNWKKVHLEKRLHNNRGKARFPLLGQESPSNSGMSDQDFVRVTKEVKRALKKNSHLLDILASTIVDVLDRFSSGEATPDNAREAARKIADIFDLDTDFLRIVENYAKDRLISFASIHFNVPKKKMHEILITKDEIVVQKPRHYDIRWRSELD